MAISSLAFLYVNKFRVSDTLNKNAKIFQQMSLSLEECRLGQETRRTSLEESHWQSKRKRFQAGADILKGNTIELIAIFAIINIAHFRDLLSSFK